jgi:hypothetical protein
MRKSISFKKAIIIVLAIHIIGFGCLLLYSKVNSYFAKVERHEIQKNLIARPTSKPTDWPERSTVKLIKIEPIKEKPVNLVYPWRDVRNMSQQEREEELRLINIELERRKKNSSRG